MNQEIETGDENLRLINAHFWDRYGNHTSKNNYSPNCLGSHGHFKVLYIFVAHLAQILWRKVQKIRFFNFFKFVKKNFMCLSDSALAIFMFQFWNQGYHGPPLTQGWLQNIKLPNFEKNKSLWRELVGKIKRTLKSSKKKLIKMLLWRCLTIWNKRSIQPIKMVWIAL